MTDGYEPGAGDRKGQVYLEVQPVEAYTRLYDRTFRRLIFRGGARSPFRNERGVGNELELLKLKAKRDAMPDGPGAQATDDLIASYCSSTSRPGDSSSTSCAVRP
jgi:hypothetical protein